MKLLFPAFQGHLDGEATTLCNCWAILRRDGVRLGFTDHDQPVTFDEITCEPGSGFEASQIEDTAGLAPNNHDILGALQSHRLSQADIESRKYDGARIRHYVVNWSSPEENTLIQTYLFGEIASEDGVFRAELKSLVAQLDETRLRRFEKQCNADLGDSACGVDLIGSHTHAAIVTRTIAPDIIEITGVEALADNWFSAGRIILGSGTQDEQALEIASHKKNSAGKDVLTLWAMPFRQIEPGDGVVVRPGCDKLITTCQNKFANAENFRGFPFMPGPEFATSYASNSTRMDGKPLIA